MIPYGGAMKGIRRLSDLFQRAVRPIRAVVSFLDYKVKQRRQLKRQKADDPNIYPLW